MKLTRKLLAQHFPDAEISWEWFGTYKIKKGGGHVVISDEPSLRDLKGGVEIWTGVMSVWRELWPEKTMLLTGPTADLMNAAIYAQAAGVKVEAVGKKHFFGLFQDPPPVLPKPSGAHGSAGFATSEMLRAAGLIGGKPGKGLRFGEDSEGNIIRYTRQCGISIIGPPRTGKQATIATTMLIENEDSAWLLADGKLELLAITERRRKSLGPVRKIIPFKEDLPLSLQHHADESDNYNRLHFMNPRSESYVIENDLVASTVIVPEGGESSGDKNGFFTEGAQLGVSGINMFLVENCPAEATLPRMAEIVATDELFTVAELAMKIGSPAIKARMATFGDPRAKEMKGGINDILRTLRKGTKWLCDPAIKRVLETPKNPWRFDDLKRGDHPMTIYIGVPSKYVQAASGLMRLLFGSAASDLIGTAPGRWPVKLLADEFHTMGTLDVFSTGFSEGAGHGLALIPICQTGAQLAEVWGENGKRNIEAGCELQIFLPPRDPRQASEIASLAGSRTILTGSYSHSGRGNAPGNVSIGETGQQLLDAHTAMALGPDQMVIHAPGLVPDIIIARRRPYWEYPEINALCDPNPYAPPGAGTGKGAASKNLESKIETLAKGPEVNAMLSEEELTQLFDENTRLKRILFGIVAGVIALVLAVVMLAHRPRGNPTDAAAITENTEEKTDNQETQKDAVESPPPRPAPRIHPRPRPPAAAKLKFPPPSPPVAVPPVPVPVEPLPLIAPPLPVTPIIHGTVHVRHRNPFRWLRKLWPFHRRHKGAVK